MYKEWISKALDTRLEGIEYTKHCIVLKEDIAPYVTHRKTFELYGKSSNVVQFM